MDDVQFGKVAGSLVLTFLLSWFFTLIARDGNPDLIDNRVKKSLAICSGVGLGILGMFYAAAQDLSFKINFASWVDYILVGFIMGCMAIGMNELMKRGK